MYYVNQLEACGEYYECCEQSSKCKKLARVNNRGDCYAALHSQPADILVFTNFTQIHKC